MEFAFADLGLLACCSSGNANKRIRAMAATARKMHVDDSFGKLILESHEEVILKCPLKPWTSWRLLRQSVTAESAIYFQRT